MGALDLKSNIGMAVLFPKAQKTASATIQGTDVSDFMGATFVIDVGTHTADDMSITFQESDDNSTWTDIAAADLDGTQDRAIVAADDSTQIFAGYTGNKKYIGAVITDGGTGDAVFGVYVIKGYPKDIPQNS